MKKNICLFYMKGQQLFKAFISGASLPAVILFYLGFKSLESQYKMENMHKLLHGKNPYFVYTLTAPIYFGMVSICAVLISHKLNINFRYGYLIMSLISPLLVSLFIKINDVYTFDEKRWKMQYLYLYLYHMVNYNLIIANVYYLLK